MTYFLYKSNMYLSSLIDKKREMSTASASLQYLSQLAWAHLIEQSRDKTLQLPDFSAIALQLQDEFSREERVTAPCSPTTTPGRGVSQAQPQQPIDDSFIRLRHPEQLQRSRALQSEAARSSGVFSVLGKLSRFVPLKRQNSAPPSSLAPAPASDALLTAKSILETAARSGQVTWPALVRAYQLSESSFLEGDWWDPHLLSSYGVAGRDLLAVRNFTLMSLIQLRPSAEELLTLQLTAATLVQWYQLDHCKLVALRITSWDWVHQLGLTKQLLSGSMGLNQTTAREYLFSPAREEALRWRIEDMVQMGYTAQELQALGIWLPSSPSHNNHRTY